MDHGTPFEITATGFISHPWGFGPHTHEDEHEFHYLPSANCSLQSGARLTRLQDHCLTYSEPRTEHSTVENDPSHLLSWYYFRFRLAPQQHQLALWLRQTFAPRNKLQLTPSIEPRVREIFLQLQSPSELLQRSGAHLFAAFIFEAAWSGSRPRSSDTTKHIEELVSWMHGHLSEPLELHAVARRVQLDKSYLIRLFKQKLGATPTQYFNGLKVQTAAHLLRSTKLSIREVAEQLGFCDEFYFSRVFKRFFKVSPGTYRRANNHSLTGNG